LLIVQAMRQKEDMQSELSNRDCINPHFELEF